MEHLPLLLVCLGVCLLCESTYGAAPVFSGTTIAIAENQAGGTKLGSVAVTNTPNATSIVSQPYDGQFTVALNAGKTTVDISLTAGFELDYEKQKVITLVIRASSDVSATATVTLNVTDVVEEFTNSIIGQCFSGTSYGAGTGLITVAASQPGVTATYTITAQSPDIGHLSMNSNTGLISVAPGKTIDGAVSPVYQVTVQLVSTVPSATTSTATVYLGFGCGGSGAPAITIGAVTLLMALLVAILQ